MKEHKFDLEERTVLFAKNVRQFVAMIEKRLINIDDLKQVLRSSGSIAANYSEANHSLTKKDFRHRINIARKEAKETYIWFSMLCVSNVEEDKRSRLANEALELTKILSAIAMKSR